VPISELNFKTDCTGMSKASTLSVLEITMRTSLLVHANRSFLQSFASEVVYNFRKFSSLTAVQLFFPASRHYSATPHFPFFIYYYIFNNKKRRKNLLVPILITPL